MLAMAVVMGIGRFVYTPILPLMIADGALDASGAGLVAGLNYLGYFIGALAASAGIFAPHRRKWFFATLATSVLTTAVMAFAGTFAFMAFVRFLSGAASAFAMLFGTNMVITKLAEAGRPQLAAFHFAGVGVGIAGSAILVSLLAAGGVHWPAVWLFTGGVAAVAFVLIALLLPPTASESRPAKRKSGEPSGYGLPLAVLALSYGLVGFGYVIEATFINAMAKSEPALLPVEPYIWVVVGLAVIPSIWFWNRLALSIGTGGAYALACVVEAIGVAISVVLISPAALVVSGILLGGTFVAITALGLTRSREIVPSNPTGAMALLTTAWGLGQIVGPVVAGWLFERHGDLFAASLIATGALLLAALLAPLAIALAAGAQGR
jgi:MFS family permease